MHHHKSLAYAQTHTHSMSRVDIETTFFQNPPTPLRRSKASEAFVVAFATRARPKPSSFFESWVCHVEISPRTSQGVHGKPRKPLLNPGTPRVTPKENRNRRRCSIQDTIAMQKSRRGDCTTNGLTGKSLPRSIKPKPISFIESRVCHLKISPRKSPGVL